MSTVKRALAMAVLLQSFLASFVCAQNENWMSELKADRESLERLLEYTEVKKLIKRIDAAYGHSGYECEDRPCYELYHKDAKDHPEGKWIFDICIPLRE